METNYKGRPIHKGPRGGRYVLEKGKKIYKFRVATISPPPTNVNTNVKGRPIHKGPRGGRYVLENGKKIYKFRVAPKPPSRSSIPERVKQRLIKLAANVRRRRTSPGRILNIKNINIKFKSFNTIDPTKHMNTTDETLHISVPVVGTGKLANMIKNGTVLGVTEDTLPPQSWFDAQAAYLSSLDSLDLYTAMSYTVRSHQWIGPWLRGKKSAVQFTKPYGHTTPLYSQIMKIASSSSPGVSWAKNLLAARNPYDTFRDSMPSKFPKEVITRAIEMYVKDLQRIIRKAPPLPKTIYVYRGLQTNIFRGKIGSKNTLNEFASAGYIPQSVYASDSYIRMKLLKGTRVLLLQGLNHWNSDGEFEIVLNKGSHYVIRKRYLDRYTYNVREPSRWYNRKNKVTDVTVFS